jgi:CPA2 family monovalent cation:H+ antiporter-2
MELPLLRDLVIIFGLAIISAFICHRIKIPPLIGLLFTGVLTGPHGLSLIHAEKEVEMMAEFGVILLLFSIGLEFSLRRLLKMKRLVIGGGSLQVFSAFILTFGLSLYFGREVSVSIFYGFLVALSSTAIVLKLLQEESKLDTAQGQVSVGVLLFQDIIVLPMMIMVPVLAGERSFDTASALIFAIKLVLLVALVLISARWIIPWTLFQVTRTRHRDLFLMTIFFLAFAIAWISSQAGLSLAMGAFIVGLLISESEYGHHAIESILPFKEIFMSFFFVSIGMLLNPIIFFQHFTPIILLTLIVLVIKLLAMAIANAGLRNPVTVLIRSSTLLAQIGEFSFILATVGLMHQLIQPLEYQYFLAVAILTMMLTPAFIAMGNKLAQRLQEHTESKWRGKKLPAPETLPEVSDHLVIVGFGINGRNVGRAARISNIPYLIIETNPETVLNEKQHGEPILYGDASFESVLRAAHLEHARILVITIADLPQSRKIINEARHINPAIYIIVRTRYVGEMGTLKTEGADEIIPEEFETSVEIFSRVLKKYLIPSNQIAAINEQIRAHGYEMFKSLAAPRYSIQDLPLSDVHVSTIHIEYGSVLVGQKLVDLDLRAKWGINILALQRNEEWELTPNPETILTAEDHLLVMGHALDVNRFLTHWAQLDEDVY